MSDRSHRAIRWLGVTAGLLVLTGCGQISGGNEAPFPPCGGPGRAQANCVQAPTDQGWTKHPVVDRNGFDRPMTAMTIDVPPGWQVTSQIRWDGVDGQCSIGIASANIRLVSPDGGRQIDFLPGFLVSSFSDAIVGKGAQPGDYCVVATAVSGEQLVREIAVPRLRPGWTIEAITPVALPPELAQSVERMRRLGGAMGGQLDGYALETILTNPNSAQVENLYLAGTVTQLPQLVAGLRASVLNQNLQSWSVRGPRDQLPALQAMADRIRTAVQIDPDWQRQIQEHIEKVTKPAEQRRGGGGSGGGGTSRGGGSPGGGVDLDKWRDDQRRSDKDQRDRVDGIYERERCVDPDTGAVYFVSIHTGCR